MAELMRGGGDAQHLSEDDLVWFYYGEAENSTEIDLHLTLCAKCRASFESLKSTFAEVNSWTVPERDANYGQDVWRELVRRDASLASPRLRWGWRAWFPVRRLAFAASFAVLLLAAFLAGRMWQKRDSGTSGIATAAARERILAVALSDHLEQSERTLLEIANEGDNSHADLSAQQQRAQGLIMQNRLYRQVATRQGNVMVASVLDDLERVLLDIAHEPAQVSGPELNRLRARVEDQELLFKLRVLNARLRELKDSPIPRSGRAQPKSEDSKG